MYVWCWRCSFSQKPPSLSLSSGGGTRLASEWALDHAAGVWGAAGLWQRRDRHWHRKAILIFSPFFFFTLSLSLLQVPTPTVQLAVKLLECDGGGIVVTSSHNPIEWNGLKFISSDSLFLSPAQCGTLYALSAAPPYASRQGGALVADASWTHRHVQELLACPSLQPVIEKIRARQRRVRPYTVALVIIHSP
jgi:hypothetical protein